MIFAALFTCPILTSWVQQTEIVAPDEILGQIDDRLRQADLAMMVRCLLSDVTHQLCDLCEQVKPSVMQS